MAGGDHAIEIDFVRKVRGLFEQRRHEGGGERVGQFAGELHAGDVTGAKFGQRTFDAQGHPVVRLRAHHHPHAPPPHHGGGGAPGSHKEKRATPAWQVEIEIERHHDRQPHQKDGRRIHARRHQCHAARPIADLLDPGRDGRSGGLERLHAKDSQTKVEGSTLNVGRFRRMGAVRRAGLTSAARLWGAVA
jgi:hypothetical protein